MYIYQIMSNSFGYLDIILLGMIAGFIILRLRSILGRKTGHEPKIYPSFAEKKFNIPNNDLKPVKQNHEILEGKDKKEFLKGAELLQQEPNNCIVFEDAAAGIQAAKAAGMISIGMGGAEEVKSADYCFASMTEITKEFITTL